MIRFRFELIGGPFDGERGLGWTDDGEHEPPSQIHVGQCTWSSLCGDEDCPGRAHVWFWAPEYDDEMPADRRLVPYARADVEATSPLRGVARYVCSQDVNLGAMLETFETVPAGAFARAPGLGAMLRECEAAVRRWNDYLREVRDGEARL